MCGRRAPKSAMTDARNLGLDGQEKAPLLEERTGGSADSDEDASHSIVQFSSAIYYGDMEEEEVRLDVLRMQCLDTTVSINYKTVDFSAKAGVEYQPTSGKLTFEPGEYMKEIVVPLIQNGFWSATTEFQLELTDPDNCTKGVYLYLCRVKVIDNDVFPSNHTKLGQSGLLRLFAAYFNWNYNTAPGLKLATWLTVIFDQLPMIYELVLVYCDMYLVNVVFNFDPDKKDEIENELWFMGNRETTAYTIAIIHIAPWLLLALWSYAKIYLDINGRSAVHVQQHLYRKYMNLSGQQMDDLGSEVLQIHLNKDAHALANGYEDALLLVRKTVNILLNLGLVAWKRPPALIFMVMTMALAILWGLFRNSMKAPGTKQETVEVAGLVKETGAKHDLINDFQVRNKMNDHFSTASTDLRNATTRSEAFSNGTSLMLDMCAPALVCCYFFVRVHEVLDGSMGVGTFLAMVKIIYTVASETHTAYDKFEELYHSCFALVTVTKFYNQTGEVRVKKSFNRARRAASKQLLEDMPDHNVDALPIYLKNVRFSAGHNQELEFLEKLNIHVTQGQVVGLHGPNGCGKSQILRLLSQQLAPTDGEVFVPSHLRTLFVARDVVFLDKSLIANLTLGTMRFSNKDMPRLKKILEDMDLNQLVAQVKDEMADEEKRLGEDTWSSTLAAADKQKLGLVRAFLMNPEIMLFHKPFAQFNEQASNKIKELIQMHTKQRGLHAHADTVSLRRPRTVLFTTQDPHDCKQADVVYEMVDTGRRNEKDYRVWTVKQEKKK